MIRRTDSSRGRQVENRWADPDTGLLKVTKPGGLLGMWLLIQD